MYSKQLLPFCVSQFLMLVFFSHQVGKYFLPIYKFEK